MHLKQLKRISNMPRHALPPFCKWNCNLTWFWQFCMILIHFKCTSSVWFLLGLFVWTIKSILNLETYFMLFWNHQVHTVDIGITAKGLRHSQIQFLFGLIPVLVQGKRPGLDQIKALNLYIYVNSTLKFTERNIRPPCIHWLLIFTLLKKCPKLEPLLEAWPPLATAWQFVYQYTTHIHHHASSFCLLSSLLCAHAPMMIG